jgi:hypothetical protein
MKLLVSLCNLPQPGSSGLLLVDPADQTPDRARLVDIGAPPSAVRGCVGVWVADDAVYCAWIGPEQQSYISVLEKQTLAPLETGKLEDVRDVHSICVEDGWIYVVSTGADEVRRLQASRAGGRSELVWRASPAGQDTHHPNSILPAGGRLLCTAFGPKSADRWSSAVSGYVIDVGSNEILWAGLEHPHSLRSGPDDLYVAESRRGRVRGVASGRQFPVDGYARGLAFADGLAIAGISRGRARSRQGTIENPDDPGEPAGAPGLALFRTGEPGDARADHIDLSAFGPEIYDVAVLVGGTG